MIAQRPRLLQSRRQLLLAGLGGAAALAAVVGLVVGRSAAGNTGAAAAAVGGITVSFGNGSTVNGSAVVLNTSGEMVTTYHAVTGAVSISLLLNGHRYFASPVALDPGDDVAVLQVLGAGALPQAPLGDSGSLHVGDPLAVIGTDAGAAAPPAVIAASITALGQTVTSSDPDAANPITLSGLIEFAAQSPPQGVGGAVVDGSGHAVGMFVAGAARLRGGVGPDIGYAIPIATIQEVAHEAAAGTGGSVLRGNGGYLGVEVRDSNSPAGAYVVQVPVGTPAYVAGIGAGDVIIAVNDTSIVSADGLGETLRTFMGGDRVRVTYVDPHGGRHTTAVQLAASTT
ncbi:MAG: trypsin-like peptidase domain-containing protein [Candidatus Dormibacteraeota bacterium]|nr:trypsin-like peptidase domain-containing protein [Candidatus Dormibacteraeota bacterium]